EASGIFGVFANGNSGPGCRTSGAPGSNLVTYSVGAYDSANTIAPFSARGPGQDGMVKPDIAAPGVAVRSAYFGNRMGTGSGTSMAAPHVSGAVALLWAAAPELVGNIQATRDLLDVTAVDTPNDQCGGSPGNNNVFGEGRVDAQALVRGRQVGTLVGRVTDQTTGEAVPNAQVRIVGGSGDLPIDRTVVANADGHFRSGLPAGDYEITGSAYRYLPGSARVSITNGATTTQDLALGRAPTTVVTGQITDGSGHGWPLYSVVTVDGYPGGPVYTDPASGRFEVTLPAEADYNVTIDPVYPGYPTITETVHVTGDRTTFDHAVPADLTTCTAPGYGWNGRVTTFDGWTEATPQDGWQISGRQGSWRFDNPAGRTQPPGALGAFPIADPAANQRGTVDSTLTSSAFDLTGHTAPELRLDMRYLGAPRSQEGRIEYSTDGQRWTPIWSATTTNVVGQVSIPLPEVAGQDSVRFRFTFTGRSDTHYWAFDNLFVGTRRCLARDGGLVVGAVYDQASGDGLVNTKVGLTSMPGSYAWSQWNVDPTRVGSPYWLFAPGNGSDQLWAEAVGHQRYVADVTVTPHRLTHHDIRLTAAAATNRNGS
ncbi:MAG TPA: S8 family serine peptidase, partial [Micromonospora sp.]